MSKNIIVVGAGAWGTAIANVLARKNETVTIYAREEEVVESINSSNENSVFLPDFKLQENIHATDNIGLCAKADIIFLVPPAQFLRNTLETIKKCGIDEGKQFVICSKGIENTTLKLMGDVFTEFFPESNFGALSGPTFAIEVAENKRTTVSIASNNDHLIDSVTELMQSNSFNVIGNKDLVGSEVCGAVKNVIAIACGIANGMKGGENLKAAVISSGFKEIVRLNRRLGGRLETLAEPCGIGDLVLTCNSEKSRNFSYGVLLGEGKKASEIAKTKPQVVEGVATAKSISELCSKNGFSLPLCLKIHEIVNGKAKAEEILNVV